MGIGYGKKLRSTSEDQLPEKVNTGNNTLLLIGGACLAWGTPPKEVMLRHVHQMVLERSIRWLISLRGSPRGPFFLAAWSMVSGDIEVDTDMFPDVQWHSTCHTTFTSPILACISHALSHASLAQKACLQHSSSACHRFVEYCWKFDSADVTSWCLLCTQPKEKLSTLAQGFLIFFQPTRKLLHVLVARSCMHTDAEPVFLGKVGKFGKFSVKETAFYRLCYTLPCLRAQLQEPTWPAEGLLPDRLGHMGCTWMDLKIKSFARQSTWAWGDLGMKAWITRRHVAFWVLGGEHQRKALLPKWQGLWSQNKPKVLRSQKFSSPCGQVPRSILSTGKVGTNRDLLGSDGEFFGTDPIGLEAWLKKTGKTEAKLVKLNPGEAVVGGDPKWARWSTDFG